MTGFYEFNLQRFADVEQTGEVSTATNTEVDTGLETETKYGVKDGEIFFYDEEVPAQSGETEVKEEEVVPEVVPTESQKPTTHRVKINGQEVEITEQELRDGYMRWGDYTRKTQELAEREKQLAQMAQQPVQPQVNQEQQANPIEGLANRASELAARTLNISVEEIDHWNPVHRAAYDLAMNSIVLSMREQESKIRMVNNFETTLMQKDPEYNDIKTFAQSTLKYLPHEQFVYYQEGFSEGNVEVMNELYTKMKSAYDIYTGKVQPTQETATTQQIVEQKARPVPPVIENAKTNPHKNTPERKDYSQLRGKSFDEQMSLLKEWGM